MKTKYIPILALSTLLVCPLWADELIKDYNQGVGGDVKLVSQSGTECTFLANPNPGYEFLYWADGETNAERTVSHASTETLLLRAIFAKSDEIHPSGGSVTVTMQDPSTPSYWLSAVPSGDCSMFTSWSNGGSDNPLSYLESDGSRVPTFVEGRPDTTYMNMNNNAGGVITGYPVSGTCADYSFTATPNDGYEFLYWADGETSTTRTFTYNGGDVLLRAVFAKSSDIHLTGGTVDVTINNQSTPSYQLQAINGTCSKFEKWNNNDTTPMLTYLESDGTRTPIFDNREMLERHNDGVGGTVLVTPLTCGFTITAIPNDGYRFSYWSDNITALQRDEDYLEADYTAVFSEGANAQRGSTVYETVQQAVDAGGSDPVILLGNTPDDAIISTPVTIKGMGFEMNNLTILHGGDLTLDGALEVNNLYLNTTTGSSSQLRNVDNLTFANVYVDVKLEATQSKASPDKWYAFAVPFDVDVENGVRRASAPNIPCVNFTDYLIWEYDGQMRADNKENGWTQMANGTLQPGKFYMIGVDGDQNIWRFTKKSSSKLQDINKLSVSQFYSDISNRGWNGLANSMLSYADVSIDNIEFAQVYDNASESGKYIVSSLSDSSFVMASPFFIQAIDDDILTLSAATHNKVYAPSRSAAPEYKFAITLSNSKQSDKLYIMASEDATDEYEIGKDLIKMMGGDKDSYIWSSAYGYRLCAEHARLDGDYAEFIVNLFAPVQGEYVLSANKKQGTSLYLIKNGFTIADLSEEDYALKLNAGINTDYRLRIGVQRGIVTKLDKSSNEPSVTKFIQNGVLYIRANGMQYNAQGGKVL